MNTSHQKPFGALSRLLALCAICCVLFCTHASAQNTPGGTVISNRATATYSDGGGNNFSTDSNTVTVTVANVSGIAITPDAGTRPSLVAGQTTGTLFTFTVSNTGNISDQVRFLANGQSIQVTGPAASPPPSLTLTIVARSTRATPIFSPTAPTCSRRQSCAMLRSKSSCA